MLPLWDNVPTRRFPLVTVGLIAANLAVWLWELRSNGRLDHYAFYPCSVWGPCTGTPAGVLPWAEGIFTGMFLHASWIHILGNMLFLWIFGNNVEDALGRFRFLVFYLAAGVVASLAQTAVTVAVSGAGGASVPNVGASGAIAGVLGAYFVLLPRARVVTLMFGLLPLPVPAVLYLGFWFAFQLWDSGFSATVPSSGGGVAFSAHVAGFLFGAATVRLIQAREPLPPRW
jgi:membrane associated rhomboid family serine protease